MQIGVLCNQRPIKPTGFIVLIPGVIVAPLSAPHFVAHENHGQSQRENGHCQKVLYLAISQLFDVRSIGGTLNAPVMAFVVFNAIAVIFTVWLVVLLVVGNKVVEREAIVTGDKIDAGLSFAFLVAINLGAAEQPIGKGRDRTVVTTKEAADIIAEAPIPFTPLVPDEATDLIQAGRIPGFGDELGAGKRRIRVDIPEHR